MKKLNILLYQTELSQKIAPILYALIYEVFPSFLYKSAIILDFNSKIYYNEIVKIYLPVSEENLMDSNIERWYSMKEICEYLGVSRDTVLAWIEKRNMPAAKIGRLWKFKVSEVDAWMKSGVAADK